MRKARSPGFTIIEVLIVLAVTGLLFLSATALISGKVNQTEFDQASRAFQQQIQDSINQVAAGTFTGTSGASNYTCNAGAPITFGVGGNGQGTNNGCIFIGDALEFGLGANQDGVNSYTLAGDQLAQSGPDAGEQVQTLSDANPKIVILGTGQADVTPSQLEYGLHTYTVGAQSSMNYSKNGGGLIPIGAFALVYSFATYNGGNIVSGSQQVNIVPIGTSQLGENLITLESQVLSQLPNPAVSPDQSNGMQITICTKSATTNQYALVTIGGTNGGSSNNGQLGVTLSILGKSNGSTCP